MKVLNGKYYKGKIENWSWMKEKIEFVCSFCNTVPEIIDGNIITIDLTNTVYTKWLTIIKFMIWFIWRLQYKFKIHPK